MFKTRKSMTLDLFISIVLVLLLTSACASAGSPNGASPTLNPAQTQGQEATALPVTGSTSTPKLISVVAAENFYGSLVQQLGGGHVSVVSIMSDPNVDPHEYESNVQDAVAVNNAQLVIENGDDYDTWMDKLLSASPNPNRTVLVAASIATHKLTDNAHVWYGLDNIREVAQAVAASLEKIDGADRATFEANLAAFQQSLLPIQQKI